MDLEQQRGEEDVSRPAGNAGALGRLLFRMATQLFGGRVTTFPEPDEEYETPPALNASPPASAAPSPADEAAQVLERALGQVEQMLEKLEERPQRAVPSEGPEEIGQLTRALRETVQRLEEALGQLTQERQRLSDEATRLGIVAGQLGATARALRQEAGARPVEVEPAPEPVAREPQFEPDGRPVELVIAAVPGFQGLMELQRGLSSLAAVDGASVRGYRNDEASLTLVLRGPLTARQVVDGLQGATGRTLLIEEARPEALRLRLRFVEQEDRGYPAGAAAGNG